MNIYKGSKRTREEKEWIRGKWERNGGGQGEKWKNEL